MVGGNFLQVYHFNEESQMEMIPCNENIGSSQTTSGLSLFPFVRHSTGSEEYLKR